MLARLGRSLRTSSSSRCSYTASRKSAVHERFISALSILDAPLQCYTSKTTDPYLNLAFEHFLLQNTPQTSTVLLFYTNRPSVVIGRNQNPWLEADLVQLRDHGIELVRRRSGGGAVFHDEGNVNWSVTCPSEAFTRDKHAHMVVRAMKRLGITNASVNERHDIVLEPVCGAHGGPSSDFMVSRHSSSPEEPLKVSGSAFKLTKGRALHHGTCLLQNSNLDTLGRMLRSPARGYIAAKGVESVRSPVSKVPVESDVFQDAVSKEFAKMYNSPQVMVQKAEFDSFVLRDERLKRGLEELKADSWKFGQTPRFELRSHPHTKQLEESKVQLPVSWPEGVQICLEVRHAVIEKANVSIGGRASVSREALMGFSLIDSDRSCGEALIEDIGARADARQMSSVGQWIDAMLPTAQSLK